MHLIDGQSLAKKIREELMQELRSLGIAPYLKILLVGQDPASLLYVNLKKKAADEVGIRVDIHCLPAETPDDQLTNLIESWNTDSAVHGILVQLPLPMGHDEDLIISTIDPWRDADGFHPLNRKALADGEARIIPPLHVGILRLINVSPHPLAGSSAAIIANSTIFSEPLAHLLEKAGLSVSTMRPDELDDKSLKQAGIVVIAVGRLNFLRADMTRPDAVIIDVGTNRTAEGKVRGDVDRESYEYTDVWLTPVPGGVGPMTIAELLKNMVFLARHHSSPSGKPV